MKGRKHRTTAFIHRPAHGHPVIPDNGSERRCVECGQPVTLTVLGWRHGR